MLSHMHHFTKKFKFKNSSYTLPSNEVFFRLEDNQKHDDLQTIKLILNHVKSKLNDYQIEEWARHTRNRNPAQQIIHHLRAHIHGEFVSQAFAKFYECVSAYPMINNVEKVFHSVHLCEAPGFFITSLNHYLKLNHPEIDFKWHASTLNPYFEGNLIGRTVFDDRLISQTLEKWVFGDDYDGDILKENNIRSLIKYCQSFEHCINLVTADGSIDCSDQPENQEESVSKLHLAELIVSLAILADKGSMLIKMFTFFETSSISILYILNCCFEELHIFKPATSKEGNSEVYVIGIGYKKNVLTNDLIEKMIISFKDETKMLLPLEVIPKEFLHEVVEAARFFMNLQVNVIEGNIKTFQRYDKYENERIRKLKSRIVEHFVMLYKIHPIREEQKILNGLIENIDINLNVRVHTGSHSERINFQYLEQSEKCQVMHDRLKHFYDNFVANTVNSPCIPLNLNNSELSPLKFIKFIYGLSFEKVASSKFVLIPVIKSFLELLTLIDESDNSRKEIFNTHIFTLNENCFLVNHECFRRTRSYSCYEKEIIKQLLIHILESSDESFRIEKLPLLTQFTVGVILYLSIFVFKEISLERIPSVISLNSKLPNGNENLTILINSLDQQQKYSSKNILGICDTKLLFSYSQSFYKAVIEYNNHLCINFSGYYLNKSKYE